MASALRTARAAEHASVATTLATIRNPRHFSHSPHLSSARGARLRCRIHPNHGTDAFMNERCAQSSTFLQPRFGGLTSYRPGTGREFRNSAGAVSKLRRSTFPEAPGLDQTPPSWLDRSAILERSLT